MKKKNRSVGYTVQLYKTNKYILPVGKAQSVIGNLNEKYCVTEHTAAIA